MSATDFSMDPQQETSTPAELIAEYIALRDKKKLAEEKMKEFLNEEYNKRMVMIEATLMATLDTLGADNLKTPNGTAFKRLETSVTVASAADFSRHVIGTGQFELIDFRANKTAVKQFIENSNGLPPPGVNVSSATVLSVRKPS